jgi:CBS domain-containing protein
MVEVVVLSSDDPIFQVLNQSVRKAMRSDPLTLSASSTVSGIIYRMINENIGATVVVEAGKPVGIITEKDLLSRAIMPEKNLYQVSAREVMTYPVISISADQTLKEALDLMRKHNIRRLPVIDKDLLIGLVTERRLLAEIGRMVY